MVILAFESSAKPASVCLCIDGKICAYAYQNSGFTHSKTLLPMADFVLNSADVTPSEVDVFAVAAGPGSFTGLRIGIGTVKGMAWSVSKPCAPVSTLLAMAHLHTDWNGIICPAMDARRNQIYTAAFCTSAGNVERLLDDCAIGADEMCIWISKVQKPVLLVGDGAQLVYEFAKGQNISCALSPEESRYQNAAGVAAAAVGHETITAAELKPNYLRLSQAQREREEKAAGLRK